MLLDLVPVSLQQASLFAMEGPEPKRAAKLMGLLDRINREFGRKEIRYASEAVGDGWRRRQGLKSPGYATRWGEFPVARAGWPS